MQKNLRDNLILGENTEKYITFSVPIEKEVTRISKNGEEITKTIFYRLQFINSARFMTSSLSNLVINRCETCGIKYKDCECCLEYTNVKHNRIQMLVLQYKIPKHF